MGSIGASPKKMPFAEWRERFVREAREDRYGLETLNRVCPSQANRAVVLELLFHQVLGEYGIGAGPRDWKAFKSELNGLCQKALALASELESLKRLMIFSLPLIPETFLARVDGSFSWRKAIASPNEALLSSRVEELKGIANYLSHMITEGDKIWNARDLGNLNLGLLSVYLKRVMGEWQDDAVATLLRIAYKAAGKPFRPAPEKDTGKAIGERRRRFQGPSDRRFDLLQLALHITTQGGRQRLKKSGLEPQPQQLPPPWFLKRYCTAESMEDELHRANIKRRRFTGLFPIVDDYLVAMKSGDTDGFDGSLLEFINFYYVLQLKSWLQMPGCGGEVCCAASQEMAAAV